MFGMWMFGPAEVELVGLAVVLVEEEDGLGGEEVDASHLRGLSDALNTSRTATPSL